MGWMDGWMRRDRCDATRLFLLRCWSRSTSVPRAGCRPRTTSTSLAPWMARRWTGSLRSRSVDQSAIELNRGCCCVLFVVFFLLCSFFFFFFLFSSSCWFWYRASYINLANGLFVGLSFFVPLFLCFFLASFSLSLCCASVYICRLWGACLLLSLRYVRIQRRSSSLCLSVIFHTCVVAL